MEKEKLSIVELKAKAYDVIAQIDFRNREIQSLTQQLMQINESIAEKQKEDIEKVKDKSE